MHKHQCHNELKQKKQTNKNCESGISCVAAFFPQISLIVNCWSSHASAACCRSPHVSVLRKLTAKTRKTTQ